MQQTLRHILDQAWTARLAQDSENAQRFAIELKNRLGFPLGTLDPEITLTRLGSHEPSRFVETLAYLGSVARMQRAPEHSHALLDLAKEASRACLPDQSASFRLHQELGITLYVRADYSTALEHFVAAGFAAQSAMERLQSSFNTLLCLENLGLPLDKTLKSVHTAAGDVTASGHALAFSREVMRQVDLFEMRQAFRRGAIRQAISTSDYPAALEDFFQSWVLGLPWHDVSAERADKRSAALERLVQTQGVFHLSSFRLRTLQGLSLPDDETLLDPTELARRVYLWVWWWITRPEGFSLTRISSLLRAVDWSATTHRLAVEDGALLRNALMWVALFDAGRSAGIERLLARMPPRDLSSMPIYELESLVISYFRARRDDRHVESDDILTLCRHHPLWNSPDIAFRQLVEWTLGGNVEEPKHLGTLRSLARSIDVLLTKNQYSDKLVIEVARGLLTTPDGECLVSDALAQAFALLKTKAVVSDGEFLGVTFGIKRYNPLVHDAKIFNLLSRMRRLVGPQLRFGVKTGRVFARGSWDDVVFIDVDCRTSALANDEDWREFSEQGGRLGASPARVQAPLVTPRERLVAGLGEARSPWLTRRQAEKLTGVSRATTGRVLDALTREGILELKGKGPAARYRIQNKTESIPSQEPIS